mmetsp:Transcript_26994/g.62814  ORF Transcript_26994/g.62814 Transcript_26994/m.62814 type:complete len:83 (-) Transcript_26994:430-678(-)
MEAAPPACMSTQMVEAEMQKASEDIHEECMQLAIARKMEAATGFRVEKRKTMEVEVVLTEEKVTLTEKQRLLVHKQELRGER